MTIYAKASLTLSSPDFKHNDFIPARFTCEGKGINPAITIERIPPEAKSLVLIVDDPDAPGKTFDHWIVWNIPPQEIIKENSVPGIQGMNSTGENKYIPPCPPSGTHRYFFKVYALNTMMDIKEGTGKGVIEKAMDKHIIAAAELIGLYQKQNK